MWKRAVTLFRGTAPGEPSAVSNWLYRDIGRKALFAAGGDATAYRFPAPGTQADPGTPDNLPDKTGVSQQYFGLNREEIITQEAAATGILYGPTPHIDRAAPREIPENLAEFVVDKAPGLAHRYGGQLRDHQEYQRM
jgi:hypothetical protein